MRYTSEDVSNLISLSPVLCGAEMHSSRSGVSLNGFSLRNKAAAGVCILLCDMLISELGTLEC